MALLVGVASGIRNALGRRLLLPDAVRAGRGLLL